MRTNIEAELTLEAFICCRFLYVFITMLAYVTSKLGASLYAGALFLEIVAGLSIWQAVPVIIFATAVYTIAGGLTVRDLSKHLTYERNTFIFTSILETRKQSTQNDIVVCLVVVVK